MSSTGFGMQRPIVRPIGFAHRGARAILRENTLSSFEHALELGAAGLESDVWMTADGVAVLDHDGVVGPVWRRSPIREHERAELPAHIQTLEELYGRCGSDYELSLDVKDPDALREIVRVAGSSGAVGRLWLCEPDLPWLAAWHDVAPGANLVNSTHIAAMKEGWAGRLAGLRQIGVRAINLHGSEWNAERVTQAHEAGILAFGWDAQNDFHIRRLAQLGLDGVYSDHVEVMVRALAR